MRQRMLLLAVALLGVAGLVRRANARFRPPVAAAGVLACGPVAGIVSAAGERIACLSDADLAGCASVRAGRRYSDCRLLGPLRGALLRLHDQPIDIAQATADDLRGLPGIGPALAARIVEARATRRFCRDQDLEQVPGIGPKRARLLAGRMEFSDPRCTPARGQ